MKVASYGLALVLLVSCAAAQQAPAAQEQPGSISGVVVNSEDKPLLKATVTLGSAGGTQTAVTDERGRFAFANVKPGPYSLKAEKRGYTVAEPNLPGPQLPLAAGERKVDAVVKLFAAAVITGRVVNEKGEPVVDAFVSAVRRAAPGSVRTVPPEVATGAAPTPIGEARAGLVRADDRGEFRLYSLPPGRYYLKVVGVSRYADAFYPAAPPLEEAAMLLVKPGDELVVNFAMQPAVPAREAAAAQASAAPAGEPATLAGRVVSSEGTPLAQATVMLRWNAAREVENKVAITDDKGRFEFANLRAGFCSVRAQKTGYTGILGYDYVFRQISAGEHIDDVVMKLYGSAAISGRILDEDGEPMEGVEVSFYPLDDITGKITRAPGSVVTDDRGEFRIHSLWPEKFCVRAVSPRNRGDKIYPAVFYPGTPSLEAATIFQVRPGDELTANFTLRPVKGVAVRGQVRGATGGRPSVTLQQRASDLIMMGSNFPLPSAISIAADIKADGSFELKNVPPGKYTVRAMDLPAPSPQATPPPAGRPVSRPVVREGRAEVEVDQQDVEGVAITLAEPPETVTIKGRARCDCQPGEKIQVGNFLLSRVERSPSGGLPGFGMSVRTDNDLNFTVEAPVGARVFLSGLATVTSAAGEPVQAYIKSASLGDEDVGQAEFTIARGMAATPLDVVFSPSCPRIDGVVVDADNKPVANAQVTGVPEERFRNRFGSSSYYLTEQTNPKGEFSIRYARPGEYTLFAVEGEPGLKFVLVNDAFAKKHAGEGSKLKAEERQRYSVVLHLVKLEE